MAQPAGYLRGQYRGLAELSRAAGTRVTLGTVTAADWDAVTPAGSDAVWLMGVWERSPAGLELARANAGLLESFREALPDVRDDDIIGSPYCVHRYVADERFGGPAGLAAARAALAARGARLILDYVPNHVAPDHPWVTEHPEFFIQGDDDDLKADPAGWLRVGGHVLAHGRDPYFPPWPDVVQLNAFAPAARAATARTLSDIAGQCDGIRCDMAMLMFNDIFAKTWGSWAGPRPAAEFWPAVIAELRAGHPETVLIAEAYWDTEWALQQQGFAFCYDKRLYDRILEEHPSDVRGHLRADLGYQSGMVRFLENHDEPRIAGQLPPVVQRAAAVAIATLPGATFWHEGQFEGRHVRVPVFLDRRPDEPPDEQLAAWYRDLLRVVAEHKVRAGAWQLLQAGGWPDNQSCQNLVAWAWTPGDAEGAGGHVVVVNLSEAPAQAQVPLPWPDLPGRHWNLLDLLSGDEFGRDGGQLADPGLYVELRPGQFYLLAVRAAA
jgi:hypothetical protein